MGRRLGFFAGGLRLGWQWTLNGESYPRMPMLVVARGELVKITFANNSGADHLMHLHGHHMVASPSAPGTRVSGCSTATTSTTRRGGLTTHPVYEDVFTPFEIGEATPNQPE